jgi:hypothetical protein
LVVLVGQIAVILSVDHHEGLTGSLLVYLMRPAFVLAGIIAALAFYGSYRRPHPKRSTPLKHPIASHVASRIVTEFNGRTHTLFPRRKLPGLMPKNIGSTLRQKRL